MNIKLLVIVITFFISFFTRGFLERLLVFLNGMLCTFLILNWRREKRKVLFQIANSFLIGYLIIIGFLWAIKYRLSSEDHIFRNENYGTKAVILVVEGEPENFHLPMAIKNTLNHTGLYQIPILPFLLYSQKLDYEKVESFAPYTNAIDLQQQFENLLSNKFNIYVTYTRKSPYLQEGLRNAIMDGNQKVIVTPLLITEDESYNTTIEYCNTINTTSHQVLLSNTPPLWNSDGIALLYVSKINQAVGNNNLQRIGVIMLGSEGYTNSSDTSTQQEQLLREKIKTLLIDEGYINYQLKEAEINQGDIKKEIEELMEYGVSNILLINTHSFYETIQQQVEIINSIEAIEDSSNIVIKKINITVTEPEVTYEAAKRINLLNMQN